MASKTEYAISTLKPTQISVGKEKISTRLYGLKKELRLEATARGISLNAYIIEILKCRDADKIVSSIKCSRPCEPCIVDKNLIQ